MNRDAEDAALMSVKALMTAIRALAAAVDGMVGVANQPRTENEPTGLRWANRALDEMSGRREIFVAELKSRMSCGDRVEDEERIRLVGAYELAEAGEDIADVARWVIGQERESIFRSQRRAS